MISPSHPLLQSWSERDNSKIKPGTCPETEPVFQLIASHGS